MAYFIVFFIGLLVGMYLQRSRSPQQSGNVGSGVAATRDVTDAEVEDLLRQGRKIDAVKRYREIHRCDIATATHMVETLEKINHL